MALASAWLPYYRPRPQARLRLFCFPYAGGGASLYSRWADGLPEQVDLCAVQLPGRENRLSEPALDSIEATVEAAAVGLEPYLDRPFALFGHSMGARVGFELARRLRREKGLRAAYLFASASRAPHIPRDAKPIHHLPDRDFTEELRALQGIPDAVLQDAELRALFLPVLRADFCAVETYRFTPGEPLGCPIHVFGGSEDAQVPRHHLEGWEQHTQRSCTVETLTGGHFFLQPQRDALTRRVSEKLAPLVAGG